ncbi:MAG: DNA translocase FtsK [Oscillospiraceae bacterium]|nr:DNA translocase FtsK [Oscillospiraceae bacterium]
MAVNPDTGNKMIFRESVKLLYDNGKDMIGGGLISGVIVIPLIMLFDVTGAKIIVTLLVIMLFMLLTNRGFTEMLRLIAKPFVWIWHGITNAATRGIEGFREDFYDDEDDEDEELEDEPLPVIEEPAPVYVRGSRRKQPEPEPAPQPEPRRPSRRERDDDAAHLREVERMLAKGAAPPKRTALRNIDLDIPIYDSGATVQPDEVNKLTGSEDEGVNGFKMSKEEEAHFQALVEHAAQESEAERNRLPWLEDEGETADSSIYEDEPEIPYTAPSLSLLRRADNNANDADKSAELREKGALLVDTLASFGVSVRITGIRRGPAVTRYEIQPAAGVKISKITSLADDIGLNLGGLSVRISQVEGKPALGVEVPNNTKDTVSLREILESKEFQDSESRLTFAVGKDIDGHVILGDIAKMPHMIIAGTTGSGKSVCTNSIIMSILFHASPDEVRLVLIDPKVVEFQPYDGIPHLLIPVVTNPQKAAGALNWAVIEMERRYMLCAQYGVRDLKGYNAVAEKTPELKPLPQILIIIDEFADLMMTSGKEVETAVIRIAQKARAAGIHLVIATQRPTVDVITGLIKSNVPSRIGMSVKSSRDSINILDCTGAETLLGNGDLLFYPNGFHEPKRVQGCFCSDSEVEAVASFLKSGGTVEYDAEIMNAVEQNTPADKGEKPAADDDPGELTGEEALIVKAAELAVDMGQLSTTALQRRLKLGYAKAARIVDELESRGIVGPSEGAKPRKVLMTPQELTEWKCRLAAKGGKVE